MLETEIAALSNGSPEVLDLDIHLSKYPGKHLF